MPPNTTKAARGHKESAPRAKVKKDKAAPKQARSAYTFYLEEVYLFPLFTLLCSHWPILAVSQSTPAITNTSFYVLILCCAGTRSN
jgi:hypothetical protein